MALSEKLSRSSGMALFVGGLLSAGSWLLFAAFDPNHEYYGSALWLPSNLLGVIGAILMIWGLIGVQAHQARRGGKLSLVGFVMTLLGLLGWGIVGQTFETFFAQSFGSSGLPVLVMVPYGLGALFFLVGSLLFAIAVMRARVLPRWAGAIVVIGSLLGLTRGLTSAVIGSLLDLTGGFVQTIIVTGGAVLLYSGFAWLGYALSSRSRDAITQTSSSPAGVRD